MNVKTAPKQSKPGKSPRESCYDKSYFDKWYRDPGHRISTAASTLRKAAMAVGVAEFFLGRKVRQVLDVGCGEGQWQPALMSLRPGLHYTGIDSSEYAIRRFGKTRNLRKGSFGNLPALRSTYDLIICSDCLYYIEDAELIAGLQILVAHLEGIAFLEVYPSEIALEGDTSGMVPRPLAFYRKLFRNVGLISCGPHCYAPLHLHEEVTPAERGWL